MSLKKALNRLIEETKKEKATHLVIFRHSNWEYEVVPNTPIWRSGFYATVEYSGTEEQCERFRQDLELGYKENL